MGMKNIAGPKEYTKNSAKPGGRIVSNEDNQPSKSGEVSRKPKHGGFRSIAAKKMLKG